MEKCTNSGVINALDAGSCGGLIGHAEGEMLVIRNNVNQNDLIDGGDSCGGIIGNLKTPNGLTFTDNINEGNISAKYRSGGLIGSMESGGSVSKNWTIRDCTNNGTIMPVLKGHPNNQMVHELGGCIGYIQTRATVTNFVNNGSIILDPAKSGKHITNVMDIGGIAGIVQRKGALVQSCVNKEELKLLDYMTPRNADWDVGGVAGKVDADAKLRYCVNEASVLTPTSQKAGNIGGIAGLNQGLIYSCQTKRPEKDSPIKVEGYENVGGIVGYADGLTAKVGSVVSEDKKEVALTINEADVTGSWRIGGMIGRMRGATLMSAAGDKDTVVTLLHKNSGINSRAGGIVGSAEHFNGQRGVIINCYQFGEVRFEKAEQKQYLGGIVGYREPGSGNNAKSGAAVMDSFYLQFNISESKPDNTVKKDSLDIGNEPADGLFFDEEDRIGGMSIPKDAQGNRFMQNEANFTTVYKQVYGDSAGIDLTKITDMEYIMDTIMKKYNLYRLPVPETGGVTAQNMYQYTLDITKMPGFCEGVELYLYDTKVADREIRDDDGTKALMGPVKSEITMDDQLQDITFDVAGLQEYVGKPVNAALVALGANDSISGGTPEEEDVVYSQDSYRTVVRTFIIMPPLVTPKVTVEKQDETKISFRITNWADYQKSAGELYAAIRNNPEIANLPIYQKLLNGLEQFTITDYYLDKENGGKPGQSLQQTWVIKPEEMANEGKFNLTDGTFVLDYKDSALFEANRSARQWHLFETRALAKHEDWSVEKEQVEAGNPKLYRYTSSDVNTLRFRIEAEVPLKPPTELSGKYVGGMDLTKPVETDAGGNIIKQTPSYAFTFTRSESPQEAVSHYTIKVTNPDNGKTHTYILKPEMLPEEGGDGSGSGDTGNTPDPADRTLTYVMGPDDLTGQGENQLELNMEPGSAPEKLDFTVQAIKADNDAAKFFLDSVVAKPASDNTKPNVVKKGEKAGKNDEGEEKPIWIEVESEQEPDKWKYCWEDSWATENSELSTYIVTWRVLEGETEKVRDSSEITETHYVLDTSKLSGLGDEDTIEVSVVRKGRENAGTVTRLNSDPIINTKKNGIKMPSVENVKTEFDRIEKDDDGNILMVYRVSFILPDTLNDENCESFVLQQVLPDGDIFLEMQEEQGSMVEKVTEITIPFGEGAEVTPEQKTQYTREVKILYREAIKGEFFYTIVQAKSKLDASAGSEKALGNEVKIPDGQLKEPDPVTVKITVDGNEMDLTKDVPNAVLDSLFANLEYKLEWKLDADDVNKDYIKSSKLKLTAPQETPDAEENIVWETELEGVTSAVKKTMDLTKYAGEKLTLTIQVMPKANKRLPSMIKEVVITVPKRKVASPAFTDGAEILNPDDTLYKPDTAPGASQPSIDDIAELKYRLTLNPDKLTEEEQKAVQGLEVRLVKVTDAAGGADPEETPVGCSINGSEYKADSAAGEGTKIGWDALEGSQDDKPVLTISDLDGSLLDPEGTKLKLYVRYLTGIQQKDGSGNITEWEEVAAWRDSEEAGKTFEAPAYSDSNTFSNIMMLPELLFDQTLETETETEAETETETGTGTEPETESKPESESRSEQESQSAAVSGTEQEI